MSAHAPRIGTEAFPYMRSPAGCENRAMQIQVLSQAVTPELREWILAQAAAGCAPDGILQAMHASGWDDTVARAALAQTLQPAAAQPMLPQLQPLAPSGGLPVPEPDLAAAPALIRLPDREVQVLLTMQRPRVVLFGGFLSETECDALMDLARRRLARSETVDNQSGGSEVNAARTSDGMFFERGEAPLIQRIEQRIAALLHWPVERGEGLQVLRYRPGAQYRPHFDYFDPAHPGTAAVLKRGGQRVGTLLMYLQLPAQGGATIFPDVGLEVAPVKGHALFFSYDRPHASTGTLHGGAPVTDGEKWVATKWLREGVFG
jgi:prolyl 4-hydroxylase